MALKTLPTVIKEKEPLWYRVPYNSLKNRNKKSMRIRSVTGLAWNWLLIRNGNGTGKGTSGMDKYRSIVDGMNMALERKLFSSERIKNQVFERFQGWIR
jgi:hypothetical protein